MGAADSSVSVPSSDATEGLKILIKFGCSLKEYYIPLQPTVVIPSSSIPGLNKGAKITPGLVSPHDQRVQGLLKHTKCSTLHLHLELQADITQESVHQVLASLLSNPADDLSSSSNQHPLC